MKKRISTLLLALCMALALMVPALAVNVKCDVGNGVTVEIPSRYTLFTPDKPVQTLPNGIVADLSDAIKADNLKLVAMDETGEVSISVTTEQNSDSKGTSLLSSHVMDMKDAFRSEYEKGGYTMLDYRAFQHPQSAFVKATLQTKADGEDLFILLYYTVCDGREVGLSLQTFDKEILEILTDEVEQVVSSVKISGAAVVTPDPTPEPTVAPTVQPDPQNGFSDVAKSAYYYDAVNWAVRKGVTNGTGATTFSPENPCTRAQVVTFLWRANGSPKVSGSNPFTDVAAGSYYYDAVLWAVNKGITTGTSATTFSPENACTRGQVVTFLWRANNKPAAAGGSGFTDVPADQYYHTAVLWAVGRGITNGTGGGLFSPDQTCTRGQIVTFLYRALK